MKICDERMEVRKTAEEVLEPPLMLVDYGNCNTMRKMLHFLPFIVKVSTLSETQCKVLLHEKFR